MLLANYWNSIKTEASQFILHIRKRMMSLSMARHLKEAGLSWTPAVNDYFAIPDRGFDDRLFVISDVMVTMEIRHNLSVITVQGTVE